MKTVLRSERDAEVLAGWLNDKGHEALVDVVDGVPLVMLVVDPHVAQALGVLNGASWRVDRDLPATTSHTAEGDS